MRNVLCLKQILDLGGKMSFYKNGSTNCISLTKLLKKNCISFEEEKCLVYLPYSNTRQIQAVYIVENPNDKNCKLIEVYNKLNEI